MPKLNRSTLKNIFKRGNAPTEVNFSDFIDSTINVVDDGFAKTSNDGLILSPKGKSKKLLSFYENMREEKPQWSVTINKDKKNKGLAFDQPSSENSLFLKQGGNVGINTNTPQYPLHVNGMAGMNGRIGTYAVGEIPGDGKWHSILTGLKDIHAFEVIASIQGERGRGKYAITHAIALATYGKSRNKIQQNRAYFGWFWNRISLRWRSNGVHDFELQMRTVSHYGLDEMEEPRKIQYNVTQLWQGGNVRPISSSNGSGLNGQHSRFIEQEKIQEDEIDL